MLLARTVLGGAGLGASGDLEGASVAAGGVLVVAGGFRCQNSPISDIFSQKLFCFNFLNKKSPEEL